MNAYWVGVVVGAVIFGWLWSRLWLWLAGRVVTSEPRRTFIAYGVAWTLAVVLAAFGFGDESGPAWGRSLLTYTPALGLWLVVDLLARRGRNARA